MAITKVWPIKAGSSIKCVIDYVENEEKTVVRKYSLITDNADFYSKDEIQSMEDVIEYVEDDDKTAEKKLVSGINCSVKTARDEMMMTKTRWMKEDGIILWHGVQSFAPGEIKGEEAHKIGVELAEKMWPGYEVIVATHVDQKHIHNHFVINSVSIEDGKKLDCHWQDMKRESDLLCKKYEKSIIKNPQYRSNKNWSRYIREDIDEVIATSSSMDDFIIGLKKRGYSLKLEGKYFSVRPEGKERFFRVDRRFGEEYSLQNIEATINKNVAENKVKILPEKRICRLRVRVYPGKPVCKRRVTGYQALYYRYCYLLGAFKKKPNNKSINISYRVEIDNLKKISDSVRLMHNYDVHNGKELESVRTELTRKKENLVKERKYIYNKIRTTISDEVSARLEEIKEEIKEVRKQLNIIDFIETKTPRYQEKLRKEVIENVFERYSGGNNGKADYSGEHLRN